MENIKKKIYLLFVFVLSLFVFSSRVDAAVMYMECEYADLGDLIQEDFYIIAKMTNANGSYAGFPDLLDINHYFMPLTQVEDHCWINNTSDGKSNCKIGDNATAKVFSLDDRICPGYVRSEKIGNRDNGSLVFAGTSNPVEISEITKNEYVFYAVYSDSDDKLIIVGEGYDASEGKYCYVNRSFKKGFAGSGLKNLDVYFATLLLKNYGDYWKVSTNFNAQYVSISGYCSSLEDCQNNKEYEEIVSSRDDDTRIADAVDEWFEKEEDNMPDVSELLTYINDKNFIKACNNIIDSMENNKNYNFSDGYTASQMITKLESANKLLQEAYDANGNYTNYYSKDNNSAGVGAYDSARTFVITKLFSEKAGKEIKEIKDLLMYNNSADYSLTTDVLFQMIIDDIDAEVKRAYNVDTSSSDSNFLDLMENLGSYTELFLKTTSLLYKNSNNMNLTDAEIKKLNNLYENISEFGEQKDIIYVIDCDDLINDSLKTKIKKYLNIVDIVVVILLMGFGIIDFTKAVFANDDSAMKKAQQTFLKRIFIAILFFLVPVFVDLILTIANEVWSFITPGNCGIFSK